MIIISTKQDLAKFVMNKLAMKQINDMRASFLGPKGKDNGTGKLNTT